ncbi:MAG: rane protein [Paenibacillus sp.]|nr:rane protein [Paenibacillus sp.]
MGKLALTLVIIGALNWLLVGLFEWDLVSALLGGDSHRESSGISRIIYTLVGLSGLYCLKYLFRDESRGRAR